VEQVEIQSVNGHTASGVLELDLLMINDKYNSVA